MKWFKHYADSSHNQFIHALMNEFGHLGPCCWFFLLELCIDKLEYDDNGVAYNVFTFTELNLKQSLLLSSKKLDHFLRFLEEKQKINFKKNSFYFEIEIHNLLNLLDRGSKKARAKTRSCRAQAAPDARITRSKNEKVTLLFTTQIFTEEIKQKWLQLYAQDFLDREFVKIETWLAANPKKNKKTLRGWIQFVSNWLDRGWGQYQKNIPTEKESVSDRLAALKWD